jgi:hypothetical protein
MYTIQDFQLIARELARTGGNRARAAENLRRERARFSTLSYTTVARIAKLDAFKPLLQQQSQYVQEADQKAALEVETRRSMQLQAGQDEPKILARQLLANILLSRQDTRGPKKPEEDEQLAHVALPLLKFLNGR